MYSWEPWRDSIAKVADSALPGAGAVVQKVASDVDVSRSNIKQLEADPTIHQAAKTAASIAAIPIDAQQGTTKVLQTNADKALDKNGVGILKPVVNTAISAGVNSIAPIPKVVTRVAQVSNFVVAHTDENDHVLVCSIADHQAAAGGTVKGAKSLLQMFARQRTSELVMTTAEESLWLQGKLPDHSCHYIPAKHLKARGFALPPKPKLAAAPKATTKPSSAKIGTVPPVAKSTKGNQPALVKTATSHAAMQAYAAKAFKPKFSHPALAGLGVHAISAAPSQSASASTSKTKKSNKVNKL